MKSGVLFDFPIRGLPWRPECLRWVMQDIAGVARQPEQDHRTHLRATLEWLCRAHDAGRTSAGSGGVAAGWTFESGWLAADIETTGWLVESCLPAAEYLGWPDLAHRARAMHQALLAQSDRASPGRIHGLIAGHMQLNDPDSLTRAVAAGRVLHDAPLVSAREHAQAAHALAALGTLAQDAGLRAAARRHVEAARAQQTPCGWFPEALSSASTTALADTIRGLTEAAMWLDDEATLQAARLAAAALRARLSDQGSLAGAYDDGWMPASRHVCLAGLTRLAACWLRLSQLDQADPWREAAWRALAWVKRHQRTAGDDLAVRDALPDAAPIWRGPSAFRFSTMSAKYFADGLMMDMVGITIPLTAQKVETA